MGVTWADSPATTSPIDAADLNHLLQDDGSIVSTAAQTTSVTLSGANKTVAVWTATDGKTYAFVLTPAGGFRISNTTDNHIICEFGPAAGQMSLNGAVVLTEGSHSSVTPTFSAGSGAPASLNANEVYFQLS